MKKAEKTFSGTLNHCFPIVHETEPPIEESMSHKIGTYVPVKGHIFCFDLAIRQFVLFFLNQGDTNS